MGIDLGIGGVERPKFTPLPEGDYELVLSDIEIKESKNTEGMMVAHCNYEVVNCEHDEFNGRSIKYFQVLNPSNDDPKKEMTQRGFLKIWIEALMGEELTDDFTLEDETELVGRVVTAHVGNKKTDNGTFPEIKSFILPFLSEDDR